MTGAEVAMISVTGIAENRATLTGMVTRDAGRYGQVRFEYGADASYGMTTPWQSGFHAGDTFTATITGIAQGAGYHCRAVFLDGTPVYSADMSFSTLSQQGGMILLGDDIISILGGEL